MSHRNPNWLSSLLATSLVGAAYAGCMPDLDALQSKHGTAGTSSGGSAGSSGAGKGGTTGKGGSSGDGAGGSGLTAGDAGAGASGGSVAASGGSGGEGAAGGSDSQGGAGQGAEGGSGGDAGTGGGSGGTAGQGECSDGLVSCPGTPDCTTDLDVGNPSPSSDTFTDCGTCGTECSLSNAMTATCSGGVCVPDCSLGFDDCDGGTVNDGCETEVTTTEACGACGRSCANSGTTALGCTDGRCTPTCGANFADCNADDGEGTDDGCEVHLDSLDACATDCTNAVACDEDEVCNAGNCTEPQGIVEFTIPFTTAGQLQRYADKFVPLPNLTGATIALRLYAPGALGGSLYIYATDSDFTFDMRTAVPLSTLTDGWTDVLVRIGPLNGGFDPAAIYQLTFEIAADGAGPWANPTLLYLDRVWSTNASVNDTFDTSYGQVIASTLATVPGSSYRWIDSMP